MKYMLAAVCVITSVAFAQIEPDPQIEIVIEFLSVSTSDLAATDASSIPRDLELLSQLRRDGKTKVLYAPSIIADKSMPSSIKSVHFISYPTDIMISQTTNSYGAISTVIAPQDFATQEVGLVVDSLLANVRQDSLDIDVMLMAEIITLPSWTNHVVHSISPDGAINKVKSPQPVFHNQQFRASFALKDGQTILAGSGTTDDSGQTTTFMTVTARLLDAAGQPIRKEIAEQSPAPY